MNRFALINCLVLFALFLSPKLIAQENDLSGFEISIDQDNFADFMRDDTVYNKNYTVALRLGIYGEYANSIYLGLPFVRQKLDGWLIDWLLYNARFREESVSHNFVFTINGFSPMHISDEIPEFQMDVDGGYSLSQDRPFSSFTGFRSTRRLEGNKLFAHSTNQVDFAVTSSFTFGFASLGLAQGVENLFGGSRPGGNLWDRDQTKPYPTGQIITAPVPLFMYSISAEAVVWRPIRQVVFQARPEINLGYYTNLGLGFDIGKVMNVEKHVDNLSYTDTNNPSLIKVNNEHISFAISAGATARLVLYNAHLKGFFNKRADNYTSTSNTKVLLWEAYVGAKLQLFKKIEFSFSINRRSPEFSASFEQESLWGTIGMKYLIAEEGEGCYN